MANFSLTIQARTDFRGIARFSQIRWGKEQRVKYLAALYSCFQQLSDNPLLGKDCSDILSGYRSYPCGSHTIFFRELHNGIEIVRILHKNMDMENRIVDP